MGPIALFSDFKLTTSSSKQLEDISHAHIVSFMYKLITRAKDFDDLPVCFDRSRDRGKQELTNNKNVKGKYHHKWCSKIFLDLPNTRKRATYGLGYKLTLTRNKDDAIIDKAAGIADVRNKIDHNHWYIPHYTPSIQQQGVL